MEHNSGGVSWTTCDAAGQMGRQRSELPQDSTAPQLGAHHTVAVVWMDCVQGPVKTDDNPWCLAAVYTLQVCH